MIAKRPFGRPKPPSRLDTNFQPCHGLGVTILSDESLDMVFIFSPAIGNEPRAVHRCGLKFIVSKVEDLESSGDYEFKFWKSQGCIAKLSVHSKRFWILHSIDWEIYEPQGTVN